MCKIQAGHNYSRDARAEMNGTKNGSKWLSETAIKVLTGVTVIAIAGVLVFGVRVYAFMSAGERFTPSMHQESVDKAWDLARDEFMQMDVYERDRVHLDRRLNRIEAKLDEIIAIHTAE